MTLFLFLLACFLQTHTHKVIELCITFCSYYRWFRTVESTDLGYEYVSENAVKDTLPRLKMIFSFYYIIMCCEEQ